MRKNSRHLQAQRFLGHALDCLGHKDEAVDVYQRAAAQSPGDAELLINYGNLLLSLARNAEALPILERVCELRADQSVCWLILSQCCYLIARHEQGFKAAERAAALASTIPEKSAALTQKAIHRRELGQVKEAVQDCLAAIALTPAEPSNHTNRLLFMLADPDADASSLAAAARDYAAVFEPPLKPSWPTFSDHDQGPWKKLRIGFLSPDFRVHSVMYFMEGVLAQLDRRQFEVYAFYLFPRSDYITERVQRHADHFVHLAGLPPKSQAETIRSHQIDILIDLAGHTGHNGLMAMAHKAAPVQATWIGFPGTTGLSAIDYLITDEITDPPGVEPQYTEHLFRLPTRLCVYRPMSRNPLWRYQPIYLVRPTPALENGHITFGSCNNLGKITDTVLATWAEILRRVPGSRILIEGKNLGNPDFAHEYMQRCNRLGLPADRVELVGLSTSNQYLTYHRIDIALDPFPLNGGTTSMDVLWMGVPLVGLEGTSFKSRLTSGILLHLGRPQWLAKTQNVYVDIAVDLASNVHRLNETRMKLRQQLEASVLMREDVFCHYFGEGLRTMWLQWLAQQQHPGNTQEHFDAQLGVMQGYLSSMPREWESPPIRGVGIAPGQRVTIHEAHQRLETLLARAREVPASQVTESGQIENRLWYNVTELAEMVLCAVPHDPVALACLAEVELAHGHTDFAVTYMRYAAQALSQGPSA
ncbi:tetratricopeptide repeat protein [Acidovorax sp. M14]|uniref:O-linked N-acetylglucosamine transferase, SPINDLY family protein n=1 Tax=Acidovorax sp. M14 TaxID=3411354 RepID=UPI003BF4BAAC